MPRLDTRRCLYGEPRLSDAQVVALRGAAEGRDILDDVRTGTLSSLHRHLLIDVMAKPGEMITGRGRKILAAIDAAKVEG